MKGCWYIFIPLGGSRTNCIHNVDTWSFYHIILSYIHIDESLVIWSSDDVRILIPFQRDMTSALRPDCSICQWSPWWTIRHQSICFMLQVLILQGWKQQELSFSCCLCPNIFLLCNYINYIFLWCFQKHSVLPAPVFFIPYQMANRLKFKTNKQLMREGDNVYMILYETSAI